MESDPPTCSLGVSLGVHELVHGIASPSCSLCVPLSTFLCPMTPLQCLLIRRLAGALFTLRCCALLQLDLHGGPGRAGQSEKKCKGVTTLSQNHIFSEGRGHFSSLKMLASIGSHCRHQHHYY